MKIKGDTFVLLWSPEQRVFHIETVNEMIEKNVRVCIQKTSGADFILVGFEPMHAAALKTMRELKGAQKRLKKLEEDAARPNN